MRNQLLFDYPPPSKILFVKFVFANISNQKKMKSKISTNFMMLPKLPKFYARIFGALIFVSGGKILYIFLRRHKIFWESRSSPVPKIDWHFTYHYTMREVAYRRIKNGKNSEHTYCSAIHIQTKHLGCEGTVEKEINSVSINSKCRVMKTLHGTIYLYAKACIRAEGAQNFFVGCTNSENEWILYEYFFRWRYMLGIISRRNVADFRA